MVAPAERENMGIVRDAIVAGYMKGFRFATDDHECPPNVSSSFAAGYVNGSRAWVAAAKGAEACADLVLDSPAMAQARANAESGAVIEFDEPTDEQRRTRTLTGRCTVTPDNPAQCCGLRRGTGRCGQHCQPAVEGRGHQWEIADPNEPCIRCGMVYGSYIVALHDGDNPAVCPGKVSP